MIIATLEHALSEADRWLVFAGDRLLVLAADGALPKSADIKKMLCVVLDAEINLLVDVSDNKVYALVSLPAQTSEPLGFKSISLRGLLMTLGESMFPIIGKSWQFLYFLRTHKFCGQCGGKTVRVEEEIATECINCAHRCYPRISPSIIVAVHRPGQILLAKGVRHKDSDMYSVLAGFVESGESIEDTVHREVYEEVGVKVANLDYFNSQPWPFPHSLMLGFTAKFVEGDIRIDEKEIVDAQWFDLHRLPTIPPRFSIAGRLIDKVKGLYR